MGGKKKDVGLRYGTPNQNSAKRVPPRESNLIHKLLSNFDETSTFVKLNDSKKIICEVILERASLI